MKEKDEKLSKKDCIILNRLIINGRTTLTEIAKEVNLSIDSTKKRIQKMIDNGIFDYSVRLSPRKLGFKYIVDVKIKLNNHSREKIEEFIKYLKASPRVTEIFEVGGSWDLTVVIIAKDALDLERIKSKIYDKFGVIINSWEESITLKAHKFENYDILELFYGKEGGNQNGE